MTSPIDTQLELAARLRWALVRMARRLRQEAGSGLSPSMTAALATVERHGPLTPSELAKRESIRRPAATRIVARLEEHGLVDRTADPDDGRLSLIATTDAGSALLAEARARKNEYLAIHLSGLPEDDLAALERTAAVLERLLEDERR